MRVPDRFHNGIWTPTDNWMEAHPSWTIFLASLIISNLLLGSAIIVTIVMRFSNEFHP